MSEEFYIDPEMKPALDRIKARIASRAPMTSVSISEMRARARSDFAALNVDRPDVTFVKSATVNGAFGPREARIYDAKGARANAPSLIYCHGGGWIVGDLDSEDAKLRRLANESGVRIISVDYVLAPEHKFPKPLDDCIATAQSICFDAELFGVDPTRLAIGGASAGANLALATAIALRDRGASWLRYLVLFYGVFDIASQAPSRKLFNEGFGVGSDAMELFYSLYLNEKTEQADPRASPLRADLAGLPPAFINAAGLDVLRDDSRELAKAMKDQGIEVFYDEPEGVIHGFTLLAHEVEAARNTIANAAHALCSALE